MVHICNLCAGQHNGRLAGESLEPLRPAHLECAAAGNTGTLSHEAGGKDTQLRVSSDSHTCTPATRALCHTRQDRSKNPQPRLFSDTCVCLQTCIHTHKHMGVVGKRPLQRWSDDSVVKNSCCSHRRRGLGSQHL